MFKLHDGTYNIKLFLKLAEFDKEATLKKRGAGYYMCYCEKYSDKPKRFD